MYSSIIYVLATGCLFTGSVLTFEKELHILCIHLLYMFLRLDVFLRVVF